MADEIKPGDLVKLKSGGPVMTVSQVDGDTAWCEWFDDKKQPQGRGFQVAMLNRIHMAS